MNTAFDTAYEAYQLRKQAEHRAHLRKLQQELTRLPDAPLPAREQSTAHPQPARA